MTKQTKTIVTVGVVALAAYGVYSIAKMKKSNFSGDTTRYRGRTNLYGRNYRGRTNLYGRNAAPKDEPCIPGACCFSTGYTPVANGTILASVALPGWGGGRGIIVNNGKETGQTLICPEGQTSVYPVSN